MKAARRYDVAFYVPWAAPLLAQDSTTASGGAETQIFLLSRELARQGVKVCLVVFDLPDVTIPPSLDGVAVVVRPRYLAHERFGKLREVLSVWRAVLETPAEIFVSRSAGPDVGLVGVSAKVARRRFVFSSASIWDFDYRKLASKRRDRVLFRIGTWVADELVVQTEDQARLCKERFGRAPALISSIAEPAEPRTREPDAFLWIGRHVWYKGPLAFLALARALPEARFRMIAVPIAYTEGGAELIATVEREAAALPNVELLPQRPRRELMDDLDRAVAVVNTSDFEGMPNVFLEAWARGIPALSLNYDPDGLLSSRGLGGCADGDPERLAELARELWEGRADQSGISERCRRYIHEHHSPETVSGRWREVLMHAMRSRAAAQAATG